MINEETTIVQIADMKIRKSSGTLITYALGSCVGISLYDPVVKVAALIHIMLPEAPIGVEAVSVFKYADSAIVSTLRKLTVFGAVNRRLVCKIAGGAKMFQISSNSAIGNVGERNVAMTKRILMKEGVSISKEVTGGSQARTLWINVATGEVKLRAAGQSEITI